MGNKKRAERRHNNDAGGVAETRRFLITTKNRGKSSRDSVSGLKMPGVNQLGPKMCVSESCIWQVFGGVREKVGGTLGGRAKTGGGALAAVWIAIDKNGNYSGGGHHSGGGRWTFRKWQLKTMVAAERKRIRTRRG